MPKSRSNRRRTNRSRRPPATAEPPALAAPLAPARAQTRQVIRAKGPGDVIAAVPFQCGFHPTRSVVVLSLRGPRQRIGLVCRLDLPVLAEPGDSARTAEELVRFVARDEGSAAVVVIYDDLGWAVDDPPHAELVDTLLDHLDERGIPALDALYVTGERFWSYTCDDSRCCPVEGYPVTEAQSSAVAAAYVMAGLAPLANRDELARRVLPAAPALVAAVDESLWRWLGAQAADLDDAVRRTRTTGELEAARHEHLGRWTSATLRLLAPLVERYRQGAAELCVEEAGQLLASLHSVHIRDAVLMGFCRYGLSRSDLDVDRRELGLADDPVVSGLDPEAEPDLAREDAVERLLVDLAVRVEGSFAAAPLTLLAWHSWVRGEGALARVAVERAAAADPTYRLAAMLLQILDNGIAPAWVSAMRREDEQAS